MADSKFPTADEETMAELRELADEILADLPDKRVVITFPDGDKYSIPAAIPAKQRALHEAEYNAAYHGRTPEEELRVQLRNAIVDNPHLAVRTARKTMSWEAVEPHAEFEGRVDEPKADQYSKSSFCVTDE